MQDDLFKSRPLRIKSKCGEIYEVRETSVEAYHELIERGLLGPMQKRVLDAVEACGPCTSGEAFEYMRNNHEDWNPVSQTRARFTELREKGAIEECGKRECKVSGRKAIVWKTREER